MNARWLGLGLLGLLLLLGGSLRGGDDPSKGKEPPDPPDTPPERRIVQVSQPIIREVADAEDFTGRIEPVQSVDLRARVTGYLLKINYQPGAVVKEGDVLFEIDPRRYQAEMDAALAELTLAEVRLKLATANLDRAKALLNKQVMSQEEYNKIVGERDEAAAVIQARKAACESYKLNLEFTKIRAPISGKIGRPTLTTGNLVIQDQTTLATLVSTDPVYVFFDVDERTYLRLARLKAKNDKPLEMPVQMGLADEEGFPHRGKVDFVDIKVNPTTGAISWRAVFANDGGLLMPGMFARVRLTTSVPYKGLLVPESALYGDREQKFVMVVNEKNTVEAQAVKLGTKQGELRVITEGLKGGEWVIAKLPSFALSPGDAVKPDKIKLEK